MLVPNTEWGKEVLTYDVLELGVGSWCIPRTLRGRNWPRSNGEPPSTFHSQVQVSYHLGCPSIHGPQASRGRITWEKSEPSGSVRGLGETMPRAARCAVSWKTGAVIPALCVRERRGTVCVLCWRRSELSVKAVPPSTPRPDLASQENNHLGEISASSTVFIWQSQKLFFYPYLWAFFKLLSERDEERNRETERETLINYLPYEP